jgi:glycosyltransferase involved in cell wall biosynthesis
MSSIGSKPKLMFFISEDWYFWSHRLPIAIAARDTGWEVYLVTRVSTFKERIQKENIHLIPLTKFRRRLQSPVKELLSFYEILKIYQKIKPDIIHQVAFKPVILGTVAARIAGIRRIIDAFAGMGFLFTSENKKKAIFKRLVFFFLRRIFDTERVYLIFQNAEDLNLMISERIISQDQAEIIKGSGVNLKAFHKSNEPPEPPIVLLPSRMLWDKGVGEFVQAAKIINSNGLRARFVLVGAPDPENPASIPTQKLKEWHTSKIVEWWGQQDDMPTIYDRAHIVCLPSYREGLPKVLLEAGASGKPVVTANTTGCRDIIKDGKNGFLVEPLNPDELANAIKKLLDDAELRKTMGMRAMQIVEEEFSEEKIVNHTLSLYHKILKR